MNIDSHIQFPSGNAGAADTSPILVVPYMWVGDFVRCHSVVMLLRQRFPERPVDVLVSSLCRPLADYLHGVRQAIVADLPRGRLGLGKRRALAARLRHENYGTALVIPRTWKAALVPFWARIPQRIGFAGEMRFGLINDVRFGERKLPRMVDRCAMLAMPRGATQPPAWPMPKLDVPASEVEAWRRRRGLTESRPIVALAPGSLGPAKRWPAASYAALTRALVDSGCAVWVVGGPGEKSIAAEIAAAGARDVTGEDLRDAVFALAAAAVAVSNDSGLLHVAAAIGTPSIGIFGPTSPWHWAPLNPLAAVIETTEELRCRPCHKPVCRFGHHRCMQDIAAETVLAATRRALAASAPTVPA